MEVKIKRIVLAGMLLSFLLILAVFYLPGLKKDDSVEKVQVMEVWNCTTEKGEKGQIVLPERWNQRDGHRIELRAFVPGESSGRQILCFWSEMQDITVFLEGTKLYSTENAQRFGDAVVPMWNYVEIPEENEGKELTIRIETPYEVYSYNLEKAVIGTVGAVRGWMIREYGFNHLIDLTLIFMGILFIIFSFMGRYDFQYSCCQFFFGVMTTAVGVWMKTCTMDNGFSWIDGYAYTLLGCLAFYILPIAMMFYVRMRIGYSKVFVRVCDFFNLINGIFLLAGFLRQAWNIQDLREIKQIGFQFLLFAATWTFLTAIYHYIKNRSQSSVLTAVTGCFYIIIVVCIVLETVNYEGVAVRYYDTMIRVSIVIILVCEFLTLYLYIKGKALLQEEIEQKNRNLKLQILSKQISPHFILNTLGAIRSMIRQDPEKAYDLLYDFSKYIRKNIGEKDYSKPVSFLEEIDYIDTYLRLEKLRFGDKIKVEKDFHMTGFRVLPLTLQPFVENAVKHGLMEIKQGGTVWIRTYAKDSTIFIEIEDDGIGFDTSCLESDLNNTPSVGLKSAMLRIKYEMKGQCYVTSNTQKDSHGTKIKIILPMQRGK